MPADSRIILVPTDICFFFVIQHSHLSYAPTTGLPGKWYVRFPNSWLVER